MVLLKRIGSAPWVQKTIGVLAAEYLRLVWRTNRFATDPADDYERVVPEMPIIVALWHGQHFMVPFFRGRQHRVTVLISRHRDGEIHAVTAERLGVRVVRGSGSHEGEYHRKRGVSAFKELCEALAQGDNVALTADVPKVSRVAGRGIVQLARASGRPIYPVAVATSRRIELRNWDHSSVNLPFGRCAIAVGAPIRVAADADEGAVEAARQLVESALNAATARAHAIVDRRAEGAAGG